MSPPIIQPPTPNPPKPLRRRRRPPPPSPSHRYTKTKSPSINTLHKKIRDTTRLLQRSTKLGADVRQEKERARAGYEQDLAVANAEKRRQKLIGRYHKIRFFGMYVFVMFTGKSHEEEEEEQGEEEEEEEEEEEGNEGEEWNRGGRESGMGLERQKATRRLKQLRKQLREAEDAQGEEEEEMEKGKTWLEEQVHDAQVDLNYTLFFPLDQKYVALYAAAATATERMGEDGEEVEDEEEEREDRVVEQCVKPPLWKEVERRMGMENGNGRLEELRNGEGAQVMGSGSLVDSKMKMKRNEKRSSRRVEQTARAVDGGEDDGEKRKRGERARNRAEEDEEDDDSDGGFFEEGTAM
ncbi:MAG: 18S rRNA maturation protein [Peltula sp. TS41687]|nr:MAG: 18S rRNA maturation protein [Peltula sp. TS41687]